MYIEYTLEVLPEDIEHSAKLLLEDMEFTLVLLPSGMSATFISTLCGFFLPAEEKIYTVI